MDVQQLKNSLESEVYRDLVEFLNLSLHQLKDIDNIQEYSKAQDQAVEVKAQKKAYKKMAAILSQIINVHELPDPSVDSGNDYGIDEEKEQK